MTETAGFAFLSIRAVALLDDTVHFYDADEDRWDPLVLSHQYQQNIADVQVRFLFPLVVSSFWFAMPISR